MRNTYPNKHKLTYSLSFWIPFIFISLVFISVLLLNGNSLISWIILAIVLIALLFTKNTIIKKGTVIKVLVWFSVIAVFVVTVRFSTPVSKDLSVMNSNKNLITKPLKIDSGLVSGIYNSDKSVKIFAGLPYAAPPVGKLRWKAPQKPKAWKGVHVADHFSDCEVQTKTPTFIEKYLKLSLRTNIFTNSLIKSNEKTSEDCLYLNIWTPAKANSSKHPVIVYIHGGSFKTGSGSIDIYNGEQMAKKGAVFVTINYRLGVFGYMANPELTRESANNTSGNYGLLDQIAALKWVKANIDKFGGNANNITVAGESAGAMSVNALVASPLSKNLFQHAIAESGAILGSRGVTSGPMLTLKEAESEGSKFAKSLKNSSLSDLRKMPAATLLKAANKNYVQYARPIVDGYALPDTIYNIFADGKQNDVPILIGNNANEGSLFLTLPRPLSTTVSAKKFRTEVKQTYGNKADEFFKLFPFNNDNQAVKVQVDSGTYQWFAWHMHTWAKLQNKTGKSNVYYYYFDRLQPGSTSLRKDLGVFHGSEIAYAYHNLDKLDLPYTSKDQKLSDIMSGYWFNFASKGDPNGTELPYWEPYNQKKDQVMELGNNIGEIPVPHGDYIRFFDSFEESLRGK